jgi:hypothetical protein
LYFVTFFLSLINFLTWKNFRAPTISDKKILFSLKEKKLRGRKRGSGPRMKIIIMQFGSDGKTLFQVLLLGTFVKM